ncbi:MAG: DinB family protein [Bacteroidota bacterium]
MRRRKTGYILLALLVITGFAGTYHNTLSTKERKTAISYLKETKASFLNSIRGLSNAQLDFIPASGKWSIRQCMDHVIRTEKAITFVAIKNLEQPSNPVQRKNVIIKDEEIIDAITDCSQNAMNTEFLQPVMTSFTTTGSDLNEFKLLREENISFLKTTTADLRNHFLQYPAFGVIDNYQFLLMMAAHTQKYTQQIEEIKSIPGFPE